MPLSLESRRVGDMTVVTCRGRIVEGQESAVLQQQLDSLIPMHRHVILHLGEVPFIDSAGLGLLVRFLTRARHAGGSLAVCALSPKIGEVLKATRLQTIFHPYESEGDAISAAYEANRPIDVSFLNANVLCVDKSADVVAYVRELLKEAGHRVLSATNLPDALILLRATRPEVVVIGAELRAAADTRAAEEFRRLADVRAVVELPVGFSRHDAGEAGQQLMSLVAASLRGRPEPMA
jgi:anti-sigma B factor antagonist